jgi:hypothetical protein
VLEHPYFLTIIGIWNVLRAIAILVPGFARLKGWAYADIFFNVTGAALSRLRSREKADRYRLLVTPQ